MAAKGAIITVANDVTEAGSGFGTDTNRVDIVGTDGSIEPSAVDEQVRRRQCDTRQGETASG